MVNNKIYLFYVSTWHHFGFNISGLKQSVLEIKIQNFNLLVSKIDLFWYKVDCILIKIHAMLILLRVVQCPLTNHDLNPK